MPINYMSFPHRERLIRVLTLDEKEGGNTEYSYDLMLDPEAGQYYLKHWSEYAVTYSYHRTHELFTIEEVQQQHPEYYKQIVDYLKGIADR